MADGDAKATNSKKSDAWESMPSEGDILTTTIFNQHVYELMIEKKQAEASRAEAPTLVNSVFEQDKKQIVDYDSDIVKKMFPDKKDEHKRNAAYRYMKHAQWQKEWTSGRDLSCLMPTELKQLDDYVEKRPSLLQKFHDFLQSEGRDPVKSIADAIKASKLVGIGEIHTLKEKNPNREMCQKNMVEFAKAGATDFFIEMPQVLQPVFDKFNNDPKKGDFVVPDKIIDAEGKPVDTIEARGGLELLRRVEKLSPELIALWKAARDSGMEVHAVDNNTTTYTYADPNNPMMAKLNETRDSDMAKNIMDVLERPIEPGQPPRKGLGWLGVAHWADGHEHVAFTMVAEQIRKQLSESKSHEKVTTFCTQMAEDSESRVMGLYPVTGVVDHSVSVPTHSVDGQPNIIGQLGERAGTNPKFPWKFDSWDNVIIYPDPNASVGVALPRRLQ